MRNKNTLFIVPVPNYIATSNNKKVHNFAWHYGMAFKVIQGNSEDLNEILSIRTVDNFRDKYARICIQYNNGTMEV